MEKAKMVEWEIRNEDLSWSEKVEVGTMTIEERRDFIEMINDIDCRIYVAGDLRCQTPRNNW